MEQPREYTKRPDRVMAVRWTGDNLAAVEALVNPDPRRVSAGTAQQYGDAVRIFTMDITAPDTWTGTAVFGEWVVRIGRRITVMRHEDFIAAYYAGNDEQKYNKVYFKAEAPR